MIYDVTTFNGEKELFDIRYNMLKDHADKFIVVEFDKTFSGKPKNRTFTYSPPEKVEYFFIEESQYGKYMDMALASPHTIGADHWKREFCQKESIKDCLKLKDDDLVFIGDVDEIWDPNKQYVLEEPTKLLLRVYCYYLNNYSNEIFKGTLVARYKDIKNQCLNHLRSETEVTQFGGWHFTSLHHMLRRKLEDSYTADSYASPEVMAHLEENIENNQDFLGRDFKYKVDEIEWPEYLKENRDKYLHLLKLVV